MSGRPGGSVVRATVWGTVAGSALSVALAIVLVVTVRPEAQIAFIIAISGVVLSAVLGAAVTFALRLDTLAERFREQTGNLDTLAERLGTLTEQVLDNSRLRPLADMPQARAKVIELTAHLDAIARPEGQQGIFWEAGLRALEDAQAGVGRIADGVVSFPAEKEILYVEQALRGTSGTVVAVAARGLDWWDKPEARAYWTAYERAAKRLTITRVFLVSTPMSPKAKRVLDEHDRMGITTYYVPANKVPVALREPIVVFDESLLHRTTSDTTLAGHTAELSNQKEAIENALVQFQTVLRLPETRSWPPPRREV